jgi:hypothetical protein
MLPQKGFVNACKNKFMRKKMSKKGRLSNQTAFVVLSHKDFVFNHEAHEGHKEKYEYIFH